MTTTTPIILHHYPQSPVSEKVRTMLGILGLSWKSVIIPRLPPKPNLMPLTGGYRLTPVMQIGADVYCDTRCILGELKRRFPSAAHFPPLAWGMARWTDGPLFKDAVTVALVEMAPTMGPEFFADRLALYFGPGFALEDLKADYNESLGRVRAQFGWMDDHLGQCAFMMGDQPGMADALAYYIVWFLHDRMAGGDAFLAPFGNLVKWEQEIKAIGHGTVTDMSDTDALDIAKAADPVTETQQDPDDALGLQVGDKVTVEPQTGGPKVSGAVHRLTANRIALMRHDGRVGKVCTHFPRMGYTIKRV